MLTSLLTVFVALFGVRLLFGPTPNGRDLIGDVVKIGIAFTLAFSWPAYRTLVYDVVVDGPQELAGAMAGPSIGGGVGGFAQRLQNADRGIQVLTATGTGRQIGQILERRQRGRRLPRDRRRG